MYSSLNSKIYDRHLKKVREYNGLNIVCITTKVIMLVWNSKYITMKNVYLKNSDKNHFIINLSLFAKMYNFISLYFAGQLKNHCGMHNVLWGITRMPSAKKVNLMEQLIKKWDMISYHSSISGVQFQERQGYKLTILFKENYFIIFTSIFYIICLCIL